LNGDPELFGYSDIPLCGSAAKWLGRSAKLDLIRLDLFQIGHGSELRLARQIGRKEKAA